MERVEFFFLAGLLATPVAATQNYEAEFCNQCSYSEAVTIAKNHAPAIKCYPTTPGGIREPGNEECYSTSLKKVIVYEMAGKNLYGFYVTHTNQGQPGQLMKVTVTDMNVGSDLYNIVDDILASYTQVEHVIIDFNKQLDSNNKVLALASNSLTADNSFDSTCGSDVGAQAVQDALDVRNLSRVQYQFQEELARKGFNLGNDLEEVKLTAVSFSASKGEISISGSWEYVPDSRWIKKTYDPLPTNSPTQVVYKFSVDKNNGTTISLDENNTFIKGVNMAKMKSQPFSPNVLTDPCVLAALNRYIQAYITKSTGSGGLGSTIPSLGTESGWNNVPVISGGGLAGGGSGDDVDRCRWIFYDRNGKESFELMGPCP